MKIKMFYHSLLSDWNHGNAHFLRGMVTALQQRGHEVDVYEPKDSWSRQNLLKDGGHEAIEELQQYYPGIRSNLYDPETILLENILAGADLVLVHEWNDHTLVRKIGEHRKRNNDYTLLFHDTHHRAVSEATAMAAYDLRHYDGVLAFGKVIRDLYLEKKWAKKAWTWHEAADTNLFRPLKNIEKEGDLIWIGNWGDEERTAELHRYLIEPVKELGLKARVYGVRYPKEALKALEKAGISYGGWLPNYKAPEEFAKYRMTVHVPRRYYAGILPGIPTIRPFEALACGIPLISAPWNDAEHLFRPGTDYLLAKDGKEMKQQMQRVLNEPWLVQQLAKNGLETINSRHTCMHRAEELENIVQQIMEEKEGTDVLSPETELRTTL